MKNLTYATVIGAAVLGAGEKAKADIITWHYEDDFSTTKAESDSYDHSTFWAELAVEHPPSSLYYPTIAYPPEMLAFAGDAFLEYAFPFDTVLTQIDSGTFGIDVAGHLLYQFSQDEVNWTNPSPLVDGFNEFPLLPSNNPFVYIRLYGTDVAIDNLSVTVRGPGIPEPSTMSLLGLGGGIVLFNLFKRRYRSDK